MNEDIANKILLKRKEYKPTLSASDVVLITQALSAVAATQPDPEQRAVCTKLIGTILGDHELAAEAVNETEAQIRKIAQMGEAPTEIGEKAFNYKHQRWDEPFDLETVSDSVAKEYIPQDEFTQRTFDRVRKRGKSKYEALTSALQPHLEPESDEK